MSLLCGIPKHILRNLKSFPLVLVKEVRGMENLKRRRGNPPGNFPNYSDHF